MTEVEPLERVPPNDVMAEQCVLGSMLLSNDVIADVADMLTGPSFYRPAHATIFVAICDLYTRGEPADPITLTDLLRKTGDLERVGGPGYLHTLVHQVPTAANAEHYAGIVRECAILRRLVEAGTRIVQMGYAGGDADAIADAAQAELQGVVDVRDDPEAALIGDGFDTFVAGLEALEDGGVAMGVPTGFADLDQLLHGLHGGQIIVVAGRPGLGKSTLAVDFCRAASIKHGLPSVYFSLEMSRDEVRMRIMAAEAQIGLHKMRGGTMTDRDWLEFARATPRVTAAPLTIDATPNQTVMQIKAKCRRLKQRTGLGLIVVDYMQLLTSGMGRRAESRQLEVTEMSRGLKLLAKELDVPVVVLSQLNRGPEQRADKKPALADLRESGAIEQDADVAILLHREDAYDKDSARSGETDLIVAKHRNGPTATITCAAQLHYSRFVDMAPDL